MSFAITIETEKRGVYLVFCAVCRWDIGTMKAEDIKRAILAKGPVLCPACRIRKCDFCGVVKKHRLPLTGGAGGAGAWRVCPLCVQMKKNQSWPESEKSVRFVAQHEVALNEVVMKT